ncbi:dephospho-CoA kinase [Lactobacillus sp. ESL0263]|uniref:dephospho-CoA kinase n=1 Tax=Lactobacillus sp. ESL0263 TaxID=2069350 RepID=UPI000EFAD231|nr:dephospho-CoA kinase [Lactobacillus sp. ESL0263]RMC50511.1 dephospho-CoA kinase [Lactobacillus sp. ESL0263]
MTLVLGLTGGIASGKSTADAFFLKRNLSVIDSDVIAHDILNIDQLGYKKVISYFGQDILNSDRTLNRKKLGQIVFNDQSKLNVLNQITHPLIFSEIEDKITQNKLLKKPVVIVDAPLLFETKVKDYCDKTLLIAVPEELQLQRLMTRDRLNKTEALNRIKTQMPLSQKEKLADYVITNTGTIKELETKLANLLCELKEED